MLNVDIFGKRGTMYYLTRKYACLLKCMQKLMPFYRVSSLKEQHPRKSNNFYNLLVIPATQLRYLCRKYYFLKCILEVSMAN
jgi:hypothetical protein